MGIKPSGVDVTKGFTTSGVKEIGNYIYVLKIDISGQAIIQRVKSDNTEIKFYKIPDGDIDTDWASPETQDYSWIHQA